MPLPVSRINKRISRVIKATFYNGLQSLSSTTGDVDGLAVQTEETSVIDIQGKSLAVDHIGSGFATLILHVYDVSFHIDCLLLFGVFPLTVFIIHHLSAFVNNFLIKFYNYFTKTKTAPFSGCRFCRKEVLWKNNIPCANWLPSNPRFYYTSNAEKINSFSVNA